MKLATQGSLAAIQSVANEKYGRDVPDHLLDRATRAFHTWREVTEVAGPLGFYEEPTDPLEAPAPTGHRSEVFENELDYMTPVAADLVSELLGTDCHVTEMPYADNFRTDLAMCEIDAEALATRIRITDGDDRSLAEEWKFIKSYRWFRNAGPVTKDEFVADGPYTNDQTNRRVWNRLRDMGLLAFKGAYVTAMNVPIHITAHAVELKQRDWETALEQARRAAYPHRHTDHWAATRRPRKYGYADHCWVVMDAGHVDKALAHRDEFETAGVGLIGLDEGGAVKLIDSNGFGPPKRSLDREHLNEKTMQQIDVDEYVNRSELSRQARIGEVTA